MFSYCNNNPVMFVDPDGLCREIGPLLENWVDCGKLNCPMSANYSPITSSMGVSVSITIGPFVYGGQIALVTDSVGFSEIQLTYYSPLSSSAITGTPSVDEVLDQIGSIDKNTDIIEFSLMGNTSFYNVPYVENLYDVSYQVGGAAGNGSAIAVDYNIIPNGTDTPYGGITISSGLGTADIHGAMGVTTRWVRSPVSVYDLVDAAYNALWGIY